MSEKVKRGVFVFEEVKDPISNWEIDLALAHADKEYAEELDLDLLRTVFNTVQRLREPGMRLKILVEEVIRNNVLESRNKRLAIQGGVMKVYSHRDKVKRAANEAKEEQGLPVVPAVKQTQHPLDFMDGEQRVLISGI